jgi:hypothetical protein
MPLPDFKSAAYINEQPRDNSLISSVPSDSLAFYLTNALTALIPTITSIFSNHDGSKKPNPVFIKDMNVTYDTTVSETNPNPNPNSNPVITLTYSDGGVENTVSVPVDVNQSVLYEQQPSLIMDNINTAIENIKPPEHYKDFFTPDRIKIVQDELKKIVSHENNPKQSLLDIIGRILNETTEIKETNPNEYDNTFANVIKNFNDFRFVSHTPDYLNEQNSAGKTSYTLQKLYEPTINGINEPDLADMLEVVLITIGDVMPRVLFTPNKGGQRPKQSYNYAHFIPLKPQGKKSFHDSKSRKVKGRRRKQSRNKHTTRRK